MICQSLAGTWVMECENGRKLEAEVPGTVLGTLLKHGEIRDPFDERNETEACRRLQERYAFSRSFRVSEEMLAQPCADLVLQGLDTLGTVELNGREAAKTDNMHRTWRIPVKEYLKAGENTLRILIDPALPYVEKAAEENPEVTYRGGSNILWTGSIRKAHYMFGWDWGPCLPDAGIWRSISLEGYEKRLRDVTVHQSHEDGVRVDVKADTDAEGIRVTLYSPDGSVLEEKEGSADETLSFQIASPQLWWPNGLGEQPLYEVRVQALASGAVADERRLRIGLRTLTVSQKPDEWGSEFAFCVNGVRFFAMGADYIPEDNILTRVTRDGTEKLLRSCREAHFNCVRVWGGGIYPGDDFFDLCDEMGLVVWQDLMYACNVYKLTDSFKENILRETEDNLLRIRHHASLGLICGNNEMETAWISWADVQALPDDLKRQYTEQFEHVLKDACARWAPDVFYWPSSPSSGGQFDDPNDLNRGDVHDWSVWHGRRPFSDFAERYPRFCSEFGFESFPCMDTLRSFIHTEKDMNPFSEIMESHQKCENGNGTMLHYLSQTLRYHFSMEGLVHATQYLQAEAVRTGVEHWRRNRGRCMGAIYWQLNDCWPVASWASIDSFGRWKALQYFAKRFFAPVLVSIQKQGDEYSVHVSNETRNDFRGSVLCRLRDAGGRILEEKTLPVECAAMSAAEIGRTGRSEGKDFAVIQVLLYDEGGRAIGENEALYTVPKHFPFEDANIRVSCDHRQVTVSADAFCLGVELSAGDTVFSDNWFTLYPGETRTVYADREITGGISCRSISS